jgi:predicted acyltransferase
MIPSNKRLLSLDVLRGLDMLLLTVVGPFFYAYNKAFGLSREFMRQFEHGWGGFTLWDIIMPLFIFMSGAAVPLALDRRKKNGRAGWGYWWHVLWRVIVLWVFGMVAQGRLLSMDATKIDPFNNTLQTIACAYLACAAAYLIRWRPVRAAIPVILAVGYAIALHKCGDYSMKGNAAICFDRWFIPFVTPEKSRVLAMADPGYTWWATIPMFAAMGLCGMEATEILRSGWRPGLRALALGILGGVLLGIGWAFVPVIPPIKHIFTLTFTAQAMGWCCLSLALLYFLLDVLGRGAKWLQIVLWLPILFGQTALLAYLCTNTFGPVLAMWEKMFEPGFAHLFGPWGGPMGRWFAGTVLLVVVLVNRRNSKRWCRLQSERKGGGGDASVASGAGASTGGAAAQWAAFGAGILAVCAWTGRWIRKGAVRFWMESKRIGHEVGQAWRNPPSASVPIRAKERWRAVGGVLGGECARAGRGVKEGCVRLWTAIQQLWRDGVLACKKRFRDGAGGKAGRWTAFRAAASRSGRWILAGLVRLGTSIRQAWRNLLLSWKNRRRTRQGTGAETKGA